jgi:hypothetical protein
VVLKVLRVQTVLKVQVRTVLEVLSVPAVLKVLRVPSGAEGAAANRVDGALS